MGKLVTIRVGLGRSSSGKILDKDTKWFTDKNEAINYLATTNKPIFVSVGGKEISRDKHRPTQNIMKVGN